MSKPSPEPKPAARKARSPKPKPSFDIPPTVREAPQSGWVRRSDNLSVRENEPPTPALEVAVFGVAVYRDHRPGAGAGLTPPARKRSWLGRGVDALVWPLEVTFIVSLSFLGKAGASRAE